MLGPGFPVNYSLQLGVRNDARKWMDHTARRARMYPWEYALGDKAYVGCPEFLSEYKNYGSLSDSERSWNDQLQFFRGRNEHLVAAVKNGSAAFSHILPSLSLTALSCKPLTHTVLSRTPPSQVARHSTPLGAAHSLGWQRCCAL